MVSLVIVLIYIENNANVNGELLIIQTGMECCGVGIFLYYVFIMLVFDTTGSMTAAASFFSYEPLNEKILMTVLHTRVTYNDFY